MLLIFDIPSLGSGGLLMEAILRYQEPYFLCVRNKANTSKSWPNAVRDRVIMHECQPYTIEAIEAYLDGILSVSFTGILCTLDHLMPIAAYFAEKYQLPFASSAAILRWTDKGIARQFCFEHALPIPSFQCIEKNDEAYLRTWNQYPAIIKPRRGSGSLGVHRLADANDLLRFFHQLNRPFVANEWMIERCLSGAIYSVEGYVFHGNIHWMGISDRTWGAQPLFVEDGLNFPVLQNTALGNALYALGERVVKATQYEYGFFHIEIMVSDGQWYIIELNPRHGGRVPVMASLSFCCDFYFEQIQLAKGIQPAFGQVQKGASAFYIFPHKSGIWQGFNEAILTHYPGIRVIRPNPERRIGDRIGPVYSIRDNLFLIFVEAETAEISHAIARAFISEVPMYLQIESPPNIKSKHVQRSFWGRLKHRVKSFLYKL
ncbi:MAG: ATP-grasp domain-containing protein [Chitinophagaceae bacterium]|nr:ATP-grasp domain-containing protein [Chitinophagaceae bacterium]